MGNGLIDMSGRKFGRLLVCSRDGSTSDGKAKWLCRCECGNVASVSGRNLRHGLTKSCGCLQKEQTRKASVTHGRSGSSTYRVYYSMKNRCLNENQQSYARYGGSGIVICDRWLDSFENFLADMGEKPSDEHSLDRFPNVKGNYEPGNCRWALPSEQAMNTRPQLATCILEALTAGEISAEQAIQSWRDGYKSFSPAEVFEAGYSAI